MNQEIKLNRIKQVITVLAIAMGISVLDGALSLNLASGAVVLLGLVDIVCIIWLLVLVYKRQ